MFKKLIACTRGGYMTEFMVAFGPLTLFFFAIWQQSMLATGQALTQHAALAAARSASVVLPDDPKRYGGEAQNSAGPRRTEAVRTAAIRAMAPLIFDGAISDVQVSMPGATNVQPGQDITVRVTSTYKCQLPLARTVLCGASGQTEIVAEATLPAQAARYQYQ